MALDAFKKTEIELGGTKFDGDLFLMEKLFPVLLDGLEKLSKEVEIYQTDKESIDIEVRRRFNPCIFLAQYLMRNNPKHNEDIKKTSQYIQILQYVRSERFTRYFNTQKTVFLKKFMKAIEKESNECTLSEFGRFTVELDSATSQETKLYNYLSTNKNLKEKLKKKGIVSFDEILSEIVKYCSQNESVTV